MTQKYRYTGIRYSDFTRCPRCNVRVKKKKLEAHLKFNCSVKAWKIQQKKEYDKAQRVHYEPRVQIEKLDKEIKELDKDIRRSEKEGKRFDEKERLLKTLMNERTKLEKSWHKKKGLLPRFKEWREGLRWRKPKNQ